MIWWNTLKQLSAMRHTPIFMFDGFIRPIKIAFYVSYIKRIIEAIITSFFCPVIIITKSYIKTGVRNMFRIKGTANNMTIIQGLTYLCVAKYSHYGSSFQSLAMLNSHFTIFN